MLDSQPSLLLPFLAVMAFSPTNLISNHSCDRKKQRTNTPTPTPTLPSPEQTDPSDPDNTDSEDYTNCESDRESINNAFQAIKAKFYRLLTKPYPAFHFKNPASFQSLQNQLNRFNSGCLSRFVANKIQFD
ncbi:hypothetical protein NUW58_g4747 [Xylaria curta]|uniref:Uncharacterized protein n=1 Tax=Xylaria curta TaxID=42375 RepID=A0ACC1P6N7_9PEZI|nr:hypothetical protein NUW58_g4747 [Xylaria curta]